MILLEQHIELRIYHFNKLRTFDVLETMTDEDDINFKILYRGDYIFSLVPKKGFQLEFELSQLDKKLDIAIDWNLYSKIEASLYSIFMVAIPS